MSKVLLLMLILGEAAAFSTWNTGARMQFLDSQLSMSVEDDGTASRREFVDKSSIGLSAMMMAAFRASPAFADVSDGNALPTGAAQFSRVVRAKGDLEVRPARIVKILHSIF
eukprot:scaffold22581_cov123-Cylindrotheca_fusiformis.AAC.10